MHSRMLSLLSGSQSDPLRVYSVAQLPGVGLWDFPGQLLCRQIAPPRCLLILFWELSQFLVQQNGLGSSYVFCSLG